MKKLSLVLLVSFSFSGCVSVPEFHTYSQGISEWNYSEDLMVSQFDNHQNSRETMIEYSRIHAYEVCYEKGFPYVYLGETKIFTKDHYNPWAERSYTVYSDAQTGFFCTNKKAPDVENTEWGAKKAFDLRVASDNEMKRREELKVQNAAVGVISTILVIGTFVVVGISAGS